MRNRHRPGTDGQHAQGPAHFAVEADIAQQRRHQRRGGDQRDRGGALGGLECGRDQKRHEDTDAECRQCFADEFRQRRGLEHLAKRAARAGNHQNGRGRDNTRTHPFFECVTSFGGRQQWKRGYQAERQRNQRVAQECQHARQTALAQRRRRERGDRSKTDQHNGQQNRRERRKRARQRAMFFAKGSKRVFGVERVGFFGKQTGIGIVTPEKPIRPEHPGQGGNQRHDRAQADHQAKVAADAQIAGRRNRPGRGRHERMGGIKARRQRHAHGGHGYVHACSNRVLQRVENHVAGIAKHGDRYQIANQRHRERGKTLAERTDDRFCHGQGGTALFQNHADDGAEHDHQPDTAENIAKAGSDRVHDLERRHAVGQPADERGEQQHDKRMQLQAGGREYDKSDQGEQDQRVEHGQQPATDGGRGRY